MATVRETVNSFGRYRDDSGRIFSPYIERGSDAVPASIPTLPDADQLRNLSVKSEADMADAMLVLQRYGLVQTPSEAIEEAGLPYYRFRGMRPFESNFAREIDRLVDSQGNRKLLGAARRLSQRWETIVNIEGDTSQRVVYVNEGDDPCEECEPLGGEEGTYAEFVAESKLPGDRCLGGNLCQCQLMSID